MSVDLKICLVTDRFYPAVGGAEAVVDQLAEQLYKRGQLAALLAPGSPPVGRKYPFFALPPFLPDNFSHKETLIKQALTRCFTQTGFTLIHAHFLYPSGWSAVLWKQEHQERAAIPLLITSHGIDLARQPGFGMLHDPVIYQKTKETLKQAQAVVVLNQHIAEAATGLGIPLDRLHHIPNGVDTALFADKQARPVSFPYLLFLGRLSWEKGADLLITAFAALAALHPDLRLVFLGWGNQAGNLIKQALRSGYGERIMFKKVVTGKEKVAYLQHCQFLVLPSRFEGSPLVALEAMAAGKAVLGYNIPGSRGLLQHQPDHAFTELAQPAALAHQIDYLLKFPDQAAWWGKAAQTITRQQYSWDGITSQYLALYQALLAD